MENSTLVPPETLASLWDRFVALAIDCLILVVPSVLLHFPLPFLGPILLGLLYYPIFHASPLKATPGKRAMGIQVVDMGIPGTALTLPMSFLRFFVASASTAAGFIGHFFAFFTSRKQALHDLVAGSLVVKGKAEGIAMVDAWVLTLRRLFGKLEDEIPKVWDRNPPGTKRKVDELERLHELKEKGAITEEEYQRLKRDLLD
jgi:uncharacterized RDD family membrane protein YckC